MTRTNEEAEIVNDAVDIMSLDTTEACSKSARLELKHPVTKKPLGIFIDVYGKDAANVDEHVRETVNERIRRDAALSRRGERIEPLTVEQQRANSIAVLVVATAGWENMNFGGNKNFPFNGNNCTQVYTRLKWVREQVDSFMGELENFMKV